MIDCKHSSFLVINVCFVCVKLVQFAIVWLAPRTFDTSTHLLLEKYGITSTPWWGKLLAWDSVFFLKNAAWIRNASEIAPQYEHEWAFSPTWSYIIQAKDVQHTILKAVTMNLFLHYVSTWLLYALTNTVFPPFSQKVQRKVALTTSILFILSSAAGFLIAMYSEPVAFTFSILGMLLRQWSISFDVYGNIQFHNLNWISYILSSISFSFAFMNRSNCLLLGIFFVYDCINLWKQKRWFRSILYPISAGMLLFATFFHYYYYIPYQKYCPGRGEWCTTQIWGLPFAYRSLYSYIQAKYWNNGLFKYWTANNIPNFIFGLPNIVILWDACSYFSYQYPLQNMKPYIWICRTLLFIMVFAANVQIINRVSSFLPLHLWYISDSLNKRRTEMRTVRYYLIWLLIWIPTQTALFACFLPPA